MSCYNQNYQVDNPNIQTSDKINVVDAGDALIRMERSRERNREHARNTRLRKKARLQTLQSRLKDLQQEHSALKQNTEESNIASILLNLSSVNESNHDYSTGMFSQLEEAEPSEEIKTLKTSIDNLSARKCNNNVEIVDEGLNSQNKHESKETNESVTNASSGSAWRREMKLLSAEEIESTRRERNRLHAKMTRERKKMLISRTEQSILELEQENQKLRNALPGKKSREINQVPRPQGIAVSSYNKIIGSSNAQQTVIFLSKVNLEPSEKPLNSSLHAQNSKDSKQNPREEIDGGEKLQIIA